MSLPLRTLVVEDEWPARNYLVELLQRTSQVDIVAAVATLDEATQALDNACLGIDSVFVDIMLTGTMGDTSGLRWIKEVSGRHPLLFVLATALPDHALHAFDLGVADYLLKPFTAPRVIQCVERLIAKRRPAPEVAPFPRRIVARDGSTLVFVPLEEILAFEASSRLCFAHCAGGRFSVDLSLSALETTFEGTFLRVHRNWLIQPAFVRRYDKEMAELSVQLGERACLVPVSRDRAQAVKDALFANAVGVRRGGT
ncbi:LytR/AlgR family response regulator transcription factor [Pendulispora albinea]|uniref:LytTR family DNA-binding domain-containing protein n=1 Tax=Pendulispora albinea TaxID=2741071 RepID=A0ABZ2M108_9BACT